MDEQDAATDQPRGRLLTEQGTELFRENSAKYMRSLKVAYDILNTSITDIKSDFPLSYMNIESTEVNLKLAYDRYSLARNQYLDFLTRNQSVESSKELKDFTTFREETLKLTEKCVSELFDRLNEAREKALETRSSRSNLSKGSTRSVTSAIQKRAEAEGAKAKLVFMEQEAKLKQELKLLELKRDIASKEAEAKVLESVEIEVNEPPIETENVARRTENYVMSLEDENSYCARTPHVTATERAFAQYVCRKDVIKDRLQQYSGKHEHYLSWKQTFKSVISEIGANDAEELDLLIRYAGPGAKQIQSIKSANSSDSKLGLERAWNRLSAQFGAPEKVEVALRKKLESVPRITYKEPNKLYELSDILSEIRSVKENTCYAGSFSCLHSAAGVNTTISKLPSNIQNKWRDRALAFKKKNGVLFPPFTFFCDFISDMAFTYNDPSFDFSSSAESASRPVRNVTVAKTTVQEQFQCIIHKAQHSLNECRTFRHKPFGERKNLLKQHGVCFKCCSGNHLYKNCEVLVKCTECQGTHATAMHMYREAGNSQGGESSREIVTNCTQLCTESNPGKSCAKIVLVRIRDIHSNVSMKGYAIIDDQSNHTLAKSELFDNFHIKSAPEPYSLSSCVGRTTLSGRRYPGFVVESLDGSASINLPVVTECDLIPDNRNKIATPRVAKRHSHLATIAKELPAFDKDAAIVMLIGRDAVSAHHVEEQILGDENQPFAQKLKLGWVIVGECCLDGAHIPSSINSMKTYVRSNGRPSTLEPCENTFKSERLFETTDNDNKPGLSIEDKQFNELMSKEMKRNSDGNWISPLPFKNGRPSLPNNRKYAMSRTGTFVKSLYSDARKRKSKRFLIYVGNRVGRIRNSTNPKQWNYVPTTLNPADDATRGVAATDLSISKWLNGPLLKDASSAIKTEQSFPLVMPEEDKELRSFKTEISTDIGLGCQRFERFSTWNSLLRGVATLKSKLKSRSSNTTDVDMVENRESSLRLVVRALQHEHFPDEIQSLSSGQQLPRNSSIQNLSPYLDGDGILRVGGRIKNAGLEQSFSHPMIIPKHHISMLLIRHFHDKTYHQGRHITEGAIRNAGFWLIGCKRQVSSYIYNCVLCRKSRGRPENQKMSDLPLDRLEPSPPFTNVGIDVFGPWEVSTRKTRGGQANSKRWALLFTCLVTRAVHIELLEEMTSSSFINALRRFCALKGEVRILRSDCGTNFVGATGDLRANVINIEDRPVKSYLIDSGINWIFNPPHSSHMAGAWERLIGVARRILDNMLCGVGNLTHEVLQTLMCEVSSIMNARPLTPVSTNSDVPFPLTPATLLTMKTSQEVKSFTVGDFCGKDLYKEQWKRVQYLADVFWSRWKNEYLHTLQHRTKWRDEKTNPKTGDIVLLRDKSLHRNDWSLGVIVKTHLREDGCVRSVDIRVAKDQKILTRPVNEIVIIIE